jgi:predicted DNA-binding transcriptional regulator AlpA
MIDAGRLPRPIKLAPGRSGSVRFSREAIEAAIAAMQVIQ